MLKTFAFWSTTALDGLEPIFADPTQWFEFIVD